MDYFTLRSKLKETEINTEFNYEKYNTNLRNNILNLSVFTVYPLKSASFDSDKLSYAIP